jgi:hypothetical protein
LPIPRILLLRACFWRVSVDFYRPLNVLPSHANKRGFQVQMTSSPVNIFAVADAHNKDAQSVVLDAGNDAIVSNAVFPEDPQL